MTGSRVHEFVDSKGKLTVVELPEAEADKRNKTLAAKLREMVEIMKLTQRVFDSGLAIFQNLEKNGYFRKVKVPYKDDEKVLPILQLLLFIFLAKLCMHLALFVNFVTLTEMYDQGK